MSATELISIAYVAVPGVGQTRVFIRSQKLATLLRAWLRMHGWNVGLAHDMKREDNRREDWEVSVAAGLMGAFLRWAQVSGAESAYT